MIRAKAGAPQTARQSRPRSAKKMPIYEYACHEGNYAMLGILTGARKAERDKAGMTAEK